MPDFAYCLRRESHDAGDLRGTEAFSELQQCHRAEDDTYRLNPAFQ